MFFLPGLPVADSIQLLSDHHQSCHANSHADTPEAASAGISMPIPVAVHTSSVSGRKSFFSFLKKERTPDNVGVVVVALPQTPVDDREKR